MQGNILTFSTETNTGIITGAGNKRYTFSADDWKEKCPVISRVNVDFVAIEDRATEIYCTDAEALQDELEKITTQKAAEAAEIAEQERLELENIKNIEMEKIKSNYSGFYRSSDAKLWKGVCAGLAHKFGHTAIMYRLMPFFLFFFSLVSSQKDPKGGVILFIGGVIFILVYFYGMRKWPEKETKSPDAKSYLHATKELNNDKLVKSINSAANVFNTLAGGASSHSPAARQANSEIKHSTYADSKNFSNSIDYKNTETSAAAQTFKKEIQESPFRRMNAVAISGAIILGHRKDDDRYDYCHKCESCGHATTNITQSNTLGLSESTHYGKFYCIKCGNLQSVEIRLIK
jgi:PspC domain